MSPDCSPETPKKPNDDWVIIVRRTISRHVWVAAPTSAEARSIIEQEGLDQAWENRKSVIEVVTHTMNGTYRTCIDPPSDLF